MTTNQHALVRTVVERIGMLTRQQLATMSAGQALGHVFVGWQQIVDGEVDLTARYVFRRGEEWLTVRHPCAGETGGPWGAAGRWGKASGKDRQYLISRVAPLFLYGASFLDLIEVLGRNAMGKPDSDAAELARRLLRTGFPEAQAAWSMIVLQGDPVLLRVIGYAKR